MVHEEWFEPISAAADDQLDGPEAERLHAHLRTCAPCRELLRSFEHDRRRARLQPSGTTGALADAVLARRAQDRTADHASHRRLIRRGAVAVAGIAAAMIAVVSISHTPRDPAPPAPELASGEVLIDAWNNSFDRADVEVHAGTTVEWRNAGAATHQLVRKLGGATVSEQLLPGHTETATFSSPGTYHYFCTIHPHMTGTVTVDA
ncbi:cupredoxin domain-containing protein [Aquihabitans sp. McL0605]|uniref:cupredoxin domain-containing protein n=1 Tax=Aquihabitans sp. McL0605 TaxID=3415671 RepID=UPI003CE6DC99